MMWLYQCFRNIILEAQRLLIIYFYRHKQDIYEICSKGMHGRNMNVEFSSALLGSPHLSKFGEKVITRMELFSVPRAVEEFLLLQKQQQQHRQHNSPSKPSTAVSDSTIQHLYTENIKLCFHSILYVNTVIDRILLLTKTAFEGSKSQHKELLGKLWGYLRPNEGNISWKDVGFQGEDPGTDFRGMGLLGLVQLVYLGSKQEGVLAREILLDANHPRRYYPFAATGINFTAFLVELLQEGRLHRKIFAALDSSELHFDVDVEGGPSSNEKLVDRGCNEVHEVYCAIYVDFYRLWVETNPESIMAFPHVFKTLKERIRAKFPLLHT